MRVESGARLRLTWNNALSIGHNTDVSAPDARLWTQILMRYREPSRIRSVFELAITALPLPPGSSIRSAIGGCHC